MYAHLDPFLGDLVGTGVLWQVLGIYHKWKTQHVSFVTSHAIIWFVYVRRAYSLRRPRRPRPLLGLVGVTQLFIFIDFLILTPSLEDSLCKVETCGRSSSSVISPALWETTCGFWKLGDDDCRSAAGPWELEGRNTMFCSVPVCICSSRSWLFEAGRIVCEGEPLGRCNAAVLFSLLGSIC